jgi:membrane-associated phospholipid phosphatase
MSLGGASLLSTLEAPSALADTTNPVQRSQRAFVIRRDAAIFQRDRAEEPSISNGDEQRYPNKIGSFTKALPHNSLGEVDLNAFSAMTAALSSGLTNDFEAIPLGGTVKLANPQSSYCFSLEGADAQAISIPPAPAFSSAQMAAEIAENYWYALTRDVPFSQYPANSLINQAIADLNKFSDYRAPKVNGLVTPAVIFRGNTAGDLNGPYISQFLWKPVPIGGGLFPQLYRTSVAGDDYMTSFSSWLNVQMGVAAGSNVFDPTPRYVRNSRDLAQYLLVDFMGQANVLALFQLLSYGNPAVSPNNPYLSFTKTSSGITFGSQWATDLVSRAPDTALRSAFYQKWLVHRRIRPEAFAGRVHNVVTGAAQYPVHSDILNSGVLSALYTAHKTYLLPQAYPVGSPPHPSYPAAHTVVAAAGVTMLKALFNESFVIPNPVVASDDGLTLMPYSGAPLTVGGELNKLASNMSLGRLAAGVHYHSDSDAGLSLGEEIALSILRDVATIYHENFSGFTLTRFDGRTVTICPDC